MNNCPIPALWKGKLLRIKALTDIHACSSLMQAAANAKDKYGIEEDDLFVSECYATQAGYLKRSQPRAKGRCGSCHLPG